MYKTNTGITMADEGDYKKLNTRWPFDQSQRGSAELDALIDMVSVSGLTRQERDMGNGDYFTSGIERPNVAVDDESYIVVETGDKYMIVEGVTVDVAYENVENGSFLTSIKCYASDSNKSTWSYVGGVPSNIGVPLNMDFVNKLSDATFVFESIATIVGEEDFLIYTSDYYRETNGPRELLSGITSSFFDDGRRLILSPNKSYLFFTETSGTATGSAIFRSQFHFTEKDDPNG